MPTTEPTRIRASEVQVGDEINISSAERGTVTEIAQYTAVDTDIRCGMKPGKTYLRFTTVHEGVDTHYVTKEPKSIMFVRRTDITEA